MLKRIASAADFDSVERGLRAFDAWMTSGGSLALIVIGLASAVAAPLLTLVHELGHASVALLRTDGVVYVSVGRTPGRWRLRRGRFALELNIEPSQSSSAGFARAFARLGPFERFAFIVAGPFANIVLGVALLWLAATAEGAVRSFAGTVGAWSMLMGLGNLVPFRRRRHPSDGYRILEHLRTLRSRPRRAVDGSDLSGFLAEFADTWSRWFALFADPRAACRTPARGELLTRLATELGATSADRLFSIAYAGWAWREVEASNLDAVREPVLDAVKRAGDAALTPPAATVAAALELVRQGTPLGLASPGANERERTSFLARAFRALPPQVNDATIDENVRRTAFMGGVALHDVESLSAEHR